MQETVEVKEKYVRTLLSKGSIEKNGWEYHQFAINNALRTIGGNCTDITFKETDTHIEVVLYNTEILNEETADIIY